MGYSLLLVEDKHLRTESLYQQLQHNGQKITLVHTPQHVGDQLATQWPDLIVLNSADGELDLRQFDEIIAGTELEIPRLVLSEFPLPEGVMAEGLLQPPYSHEELTRQINRLANHHRFLRLGDLTLDTEAKSMLRHGVCHKLTPKLFDLLLLLVQNEGHTVFRKTIMKEVWDTDYMGDTRTLDVHIRWIREKIEDNPSRPKHLVTVRGAGYCFVSQPDK